MELDAASYPEWREAIVAAEIDGSAAPGEPRTYPGYPKVQLRRSRPRLWPPFDRVLARRRCRTELTEAIPSRRELGRILGAAHGITGGRSAGPTPSAGGLQALELYLVSLVPGWLAPGCYHYDRAGHYLTWVGEETGRDEWRKCVPSLEIVRGGALLWVIVGDLDRVARKYGERSERFLLQESGHLMQNLCLASASVGRTTVPLGGYFEREVARRLVLPRGDLVLYVGACG